MLVAECLLKFDNEKAFVVESEHFDFLNNALEKIDTDAIEVKASRTIRIVGNIFDHAQEKVFVDILPTLETTLVFVNNTFHQFEDGFLKLSTGFFSGFGKLHLSNLVLQVRYNANNVEILCSHTFLYQRPCSCVLGHDIITTDDDTIHSR